ncbi:RNA-directed DNA polymerase [Paremcibacter congregatus]|uniref:RNA-directed DNA polymerase n=1 Tax=Paremcibacter congregatus TaxID=2043170 RepID=UPI003A8F50F5
MPTLKLSADVVEWTIEHLLEYGDTDIFPYPPEFEFIRANKEIVRDKISEINLRSYHPVSYVESLYPKSKFGFRAAHQLHPIDSIIFTANVVEIAQEIEDNRTPAPSKYHLNGVYSYRFGSPNDNYRMFNEEYRYADWLECLNVHAAFSTEYTHVVVTDISDFYQRIYRHRLENCLNTYTNNSPFVKIIEKSINDWRSRQSFGIPIGSNASRLLAEAALCDTDEALLSEGYDYTRYVDDIAIFVGENQDPYTALAFLAEHLMVNEGLALNTQKTKIMTRDEFMQGVETNCGEDNEQAENATTEMLFFAAYGHDDDLDEEAIANLQAQDLLGELEQEIAEDHWNIGKIRILLRAIKLTKSRVASDFIHDNFGILIPFAKDVVLVIEELKKDGDETFSDMADLVIDLLMSDKLRSLAATRAWLFEFFTRRVLPISRAQIRRLSVLSGTSDRRYLIQLRGMNRDVNYFRQNKTRINEMSTWDQSIFIHSARCLPTDEYHHWIRSIKTRVEFPLASEYCDWCLRSS